MHDEQAIWPNFPIPALTWAEASSGQPATATLWLRPVRMTHVEQPFGAGAAVFVGIGIDGQPSMVMLAHGLSARGALQLMRLLAEGVTDSSCESSSGERLAFPPPVFSPLEASSALWAWACAALGEACARLPLVSDEVLVIPTAAA